VHHSLGRAVQVDPIKPTLKAPGTKRLQLRCGETGFKSWFKCNLRRYNSATSGAGNCDATTPANFFLTTEARDVDIYVEVGTRE